MMVFISYQLRVRFPTGVTSNLVGLNAVTLLLVQRRITIIFHNRYLEVASSPHNEVTSLSTS